MAVELCDLLPKPMIALPLPSVSEKVTGRAGDGDRHGRNGGRQRRELGGGEFRHVHRRGAGRRRDAGGPPPPPLGGGAVPPESLLSSLLHPTRAAASKPAATKLIHLNDDRLLFMTTPLFPLFEDNPF